MPEASPSDALAQALRRMEALHPRVIDLSLGRIERLLAELDHPERRLPPVVHVAGTNGKGSTIAYMHAALDAAGHRVHVYTSPHLVRFNERIRLAGRVIGDGLLLAFLDRTEAANGGEPITFFEVTTAAAYLAFAETPADILLLETGLGGRLDATNVIDRPALSVITPISIDHQQFLGESLLEIAGEKAGILKAGTPAVFGPQPAMVSDVLLARARALNIRPVTHGAGWRARLVADRLIFQSPAGERGFPRPGLTGGYQAENAGLAIACLDQLPEFNVDDDAMAAGLDHVEWPGRLQRLTSGPLVEAGPAGMELWLDGGHNAGAGAALAETLLDWSIDDLVEKPLYIVFGMVVSKDPAGFLGPLARLAPKLAYVEIPGEHQNLPAETALDAAAGLDLEAREMPDLEAAMAWIARKSAKTGMPPRVLIAGSLYLAGVVLADNA